MLAFAKGCARAMIKIRKYSRTKSLFNLVNRSDVILHSEKLVRKENLGSPFWGPSTPPEYRRLALFLAASSSVNAADLQPTAYHRRPRLGAHASRTYNDPLTVHMWPP